MMIFVINGVWLFLILFFFSVLTFLVSSKHLLCLLLSLEAMMMSVFCVASVSITGMSMEMYCCMIILSFIACEAAIGLSILVNMISTHGSSNVNSLGIVKC